VSNLVLKPIVDKNGKQTHVRVNPDGKNAPKRLSPSLKPSVSTHNPTAVKVPEPSPVASAGRNEDSVMLIKPWNKVQLEHTKFEYEGIEWELAPEGYSGAYCDRCRSFFTVEEIEKADKGTRLLYCKMCNHVHSTGQLASAVRYTDRQFFDKEVVRDTEWYHISTKPNWEEAITEMAESEQPLIHAGSLDAAESRMKYIKTITDEDIKVAKLDNPIHHDAWGSKARFYRYTLQITDDATIADHMIPDEDYQAPQTASGMASGEHKDLYARNGVTRYVNEYESHGSVSVMMHPSSFNVVERVEITQ
jgi:hypothetical protein